MASRSKNFLADTGATYSVLISYSGAFSSQTCTILGAIGKTTTKRFTQTLLCCWDGQIFSHQSVGPCVLLPYGEEIYSLNWGPHLRWEDFQPLEPYTLWLLLKNPLHILQYRGTKNYGRTQLTPRYGTRGLLDKPTKLNWSSLSSEIPLGFLTGNNIHSEERLRRDYSFQ